MGPRKSGSLHVKWQTLERNVQIYLAAAKSVEETPASGTTASDIDMLAMKLYCTRAEKKSADGTGVSTAFHSITRRQDGISKPIRNLGGGSVKRRLHSCVM